MPDHDAHSVAVVAITDHGSQIVQVVWHHVVAASQFYG
jgi:hypothetical protein